MMNFSVNTKSRKEVVFSGAIEIKVSLERLWEVLNEKGHLKNFHPFCKNHWGESLGKVGDHDKAEFYNGKIVNRELIEKENYQILKLRLLDENKMVTIVTFTINNLNQDNCELIVNINSRAYKNVPRPIFYFYARRKLRKLYNIYLNSLLNGVKYFAETGVKVQKNQFGGHPKLSP